MTTKEALIGFYKFNKLNLVEDFKSHCVRVYIGCILAPVPNVKARKKYLKFHDMHHIMTGYGIGRIGESEVSAWELGSKSCKKPLISIMNLFALSTGYVLDRKRVTTAYWRGCRSKNLYYLTDAINEEDLDAMKIEDLKKTHLEVKGSIENLFLRRVEFIGYLFISFIIHISMLFMGKAMLMAESFKKRITIPK